MNKPKKFHGVIVPMITPFKASGIIDIDAATRILEHLVSHETSAFVLGTTGEAASIPVEQKHKLVKIMVEVTDGRQKTYAGIDSTCLKTSLDLAKSFSDSGVDAVVVHLPEYYPLQSDQMLKYFESIADKSPAPLIVYNIPGTTGMSIPLEVLETLSHHPNVLGLKDSERDLERTRKSLELWRDRKDFSLLIGWAAQSVYTLMNGADGIVPSTGNLVPELYLKLYKAALDRDKENAEQLQQETDAISRIYQKDRILSQALAALKVCMNELGFCETTVLSPLIPANDNEQQLIREAIKQLDL